MAGQINSCRSDHQALACGLDHIGSHYLQLVEHEDTLDLRQQPMDFVARVSRRLRSGDLASPLREANVLWTPEVKHLVQRFDSNRDLDRSARVGA